MSDFNKSAIDADIRPHSITEDQLSSDNVSHDMWEWDDPGDATPVLHLRDDWDIEFPDDVEIGGDLDIGEDLLVTRHAYVGSWLGVVGELCAPFFRSEALDTSPHTPEDDDLSVLYEITTGAGDFTFNLPTAAANADRRLWILKADAGAGAVIIDGEGAEVIYNQDQSYTTLELWHQGDWALLWCDGAQWWKVNGPTWHKVSDPAVDWLGSKTAGWTADSFTSGWEVDFSAVVPAGTKAVRLFTLLYDAGGGLGRIWWRKSGDTNISNTPGAGQEWSHQLFYLIGDAGPNYLSEQVVLWLSADYKVQIAVEATDFDVYLAYPIEYLL